MTLSRGTVIRLSLDPTVGHEQRGTRPAVVVSDPEISDHQRFPMVCVVPLTGTMGTGPLYPRLSPGRSGLAKPSCALVDHLRAVDKRRVIASGGRVAADELAALDEAIEFFLGLEARSAP